MRRLAAALLAMFFGVCAQLLLVAPAVAASPSLQLNPLIYQDTITTKNIENGHIDVANPGDSPVNIIASVRGFRQTGRDGSLVFFDDPVLSGAIKVDLPSFSLGPREAVRVGFSVNPLALPQGGVYAAVFFRTQPPAQTSSSSYVTESANIGTLLVLQNGGPGAHNGHISSLSLPFWQLGSRIAGSLVYHNTDTSKTAVAFYPALSAHVLPWGRGIKVGTGLVLPGASRNFAVSLSGGYLGLLPITIIDTDTHLSSTSWVFAITGWWAWLVVVLVLALIVIVLANLRKAGMLMGQIARWLKSKLGRLRKSKMPVAKSDPDSKI